MPVVAAMKLPVPLARDKVVAFARHTCAHDPHCVKSGVTNCRRISLHVVFCRMYDERATHSRGHRACEKLVRVVLDPITHKVVVTGTSGWSCHR